MTPGGSRADDLLAFVDESCAARPNGLQEYLMAAALIDRAALEDTMDHLKPLLLPGQVKVHWTDERESRRRAVIDVLCDLDVMLILVRHRDRPRKNTERYRRKCLEALYPELEGAGVVHACFEARSPAQNSRDIAHLVALQGQGLYPGIRVRHAGGELPTLWIPDAALGAVNASHHGVLDHLKRLEARIVSDLATTDSL